MNGTTVMRAKFISSTISIDERKITRIGLAYSSVKGKVHTCDTVPSSGGRTAVFRFVSLAMCVRVASCVDVVKNFTVNKLLSS